MALPIYQTFNGTTNGTSTGTAVVIDYAQTPFSLSWAFEQKTSTCTYQVQYTLDNVNAQIDGLTTNTTVTWFTDPTSGTTATTSLTGVYPNSVAGPITALRVQISSAQATFVGQFAIVQGYPNY